MFNSKLMKKATTFTVALAFLTSGLWVSAEEVADAVYRNGRIYTMEGDKPWAEALVVRGDRFLFVGGNEETERYVGDSTKVIDLEGSFVIPGMYDLHVHPDLLFEPIHTGQIQTEPLGPEDLKHAILDYAAANPGDGWIFGGTWSPDRFIEAGIEPDAAYLDGFMPDRPVAIVDTGRHILMANKKAMSLAGIDADTFEPDHGIVKRDPNGNPTGYFADGAQSLLSHVLPQGTWREFREAYRDAADVLNRYGFVAARSQHVNTPRLQGVQALERDGDLTVRYDMAISWKNDLYFAVPDRAALLTGERHRYRSRKVNANYVKFHLDGTPTSRTAFFLDPYNGTSDVYGALNELPEELFDLMVQLENEGIAANIHVIGDGAARLALDAIEHARKVVGKPEAYRPRHMLAHCNVIHDDDTDRIAELGIAAEFSYSMMHPDLLPALQFVLNEVVNEKSIERLWNIKKVLDSGGKAVMGSDLVVAPDPNVFPAMSTLHDRPAPYESLSVEEMLRMLTINGAWAMGIEDDAGSIRTGKYADFTVLDRNLFEVSGSEMAETEVLLTVFEGRVVHTFDPDVVAKSPKREFRGFGP